MKNYLVLVFIVLTSLCVRESQAGWFADFSDKAKAVANNIIDTIKDKIPSGVREAVPDQVVEFFAMYASRLEKELQRLPDVSGLGQEMKEAASMVVKEMSQSKEFRNALVKALIGVLPGGQVAAIADPELIKLALQTLEELLVDSGFLEKMKNILSEQRPAADDAERAAHPQPPQFPERVASIVESEWRRLKRSNADVDAAVSSSTSSTTARGVTEWMTLVMMMSAAVVGVPGVIT